MDSVIYSRCLYGYRPRYSPFRKGPCQSDLLGEVRAVGGDHCDGGRFGGGMGTDVA